MNKLYFLVLLAVLFVAVEAEVPAPAVWFTGNGFEKVNGQWRWRSALPADNPMAPYINKPALAEFEDIIEGAQTYRGVVLKNGCLKMSGYYAVRSEPGWTVAIHTTRATLSKGYLWGGSKQLNAPTIRNTNGDFEWLACNGYVGTSGNICEQNVIAARGTFADKEPVTLIVSYVPKSQGGNTTIYVNGAPEVEFVTATDIKYWDFAALGCSGWGDTQAAGAHIFDFRILKTAVNDDQALEIHDDFKQQIAPPTPAPVPTTEEPKPEVTAPPTPDVSCSNAGYKLAAENERCICNSGHGGDNCEHNTSNETCSIYTASVLHQNHYPALNTNGNHSTFASNTLYAEILGNIVQNRTFAGLTMMNADSTRCYIGTRNTFWQQEVDECKDRFILGLPWHFSSMCGFRKQTVVDDKLAYKATVMMVYWDVLMDEMVLGQYLKRKTQVKFDLFVTFKTHINLVVSDVVVDGTYKLKGAITKFDYNFDTSKLSLALTTIVDWPYKLNRTGIEFTIPSQVTKMNTLVLKDTACTNVMSTACKQTFEIDLKLVEDPDQTYCDFNGDYVLDVAIVTCREEGGMEMCTSDETSLTFKISDSDVCGNVEATPTIEGTILPFFDEARTIPLVRGVVGANGYFRVDLKESGGNTVDFEFREITIRKREVDAELIPLMIGGKSDDIPEAQDEFDGVALVKDDPTRTFSLKFNGNVFKVPVRETTVYEFIVVARITYQSNGGYKETREVETIYRVPAEQAMKAATNVGMISAEQAAEENAASAGYNKMLLVTIIAPFAGIALLTVLAATAYIIYKKTDKNVLYTKL